MHIYIVLGYTFNSYIKKTIRNIRKMSKNHNLEVLENLGYDKTSAQAALQQAKGQLDRALDILNANDQIATKEQYSLCFILFC